MKHSTIACGAIVFVAGLGWYAAGAATEQVLYSFPSGAKAFDRVLENGPSKLFATTYSDARYGTIVELQKSVGQWHANTLSQFQGGADGQNPIGGVTDNNANVLFGTTVFGGTHGAGTIYGLPIGGQRTVLYSFTGGADGNQPESTLLFDRTTGAFYGTTAGGGSAGCGVVFQLASNGSNWVESTIYSFAGGTDGCDPERSVHFGRQRGTIYGSTRRGGAANRGTVFTLKEKRGVWKEDVIYAFKGGSDGSQPSDLGIDTDGTIYGITELGGTLKNGTAFQLSQTNGAWHESVIYNFTGGADGIRPIGMHLDQDSGVIYGTTEKGGGFNGGTLFSLTKNGSSWTEAILHAFGAGIDGKQPGARVTEDNKKGLLFGTTVSGGSFGGGTIYQAKL
ncbi:MAG TPA: choice-of-anchor tandem repeat GloVer-containing protein [Rhizomicrobium sp.]|jgi:uncharacterized repeat protein (TIGR03803 family)|nr:choice-of-anchor tandem repeat GloVer-containing protein [Rhizomicrobium sp.]